MNSTRIAKMKTPRVGSVAKACTEVSTPERTRKVPISDSENARIASRIVHTLSALRFSITRAECRSAVAGRRGLAAAGGAPPRLERRLLHRIPDPPAAPAERVVRPVRAHSDAECQEHPGE